MNNNTRDLAVQISEKLHICMVKAIDIALTDRAGADWFDRFKAYDSNQDIPILDKSQTSVNRMDLQACLKFFRYRSDYAKIVFEYYGHNFYIDTDDARKAQLLLNQRLDNLIHNARNYLFAHAGASMVEAGKDDSIRYSVYGVNEAVNDMLKLASFFEKVSDDEGNSYYSSMKKLAEPSRSYSISETITNESIDLSVGAFAEICNNLGIKVATAKNGNISFETGNYEGDIAKIKLYINQNFKKQSKYSIAETIRKESLKSDAGAFVVACQKLNIPVSTDASGDLAFSSANYSGDVARIRIEIDNKQKKSNKKLIIIIIVALVLVAGAVALIFGLSQNKDTAEPSNNKITVTTTASTEAETSSVAETTTIPDETLSAEDLQTALNVLIDDIKKACENKSYEDFAKNYTDVDENTLRAEYKALCEIFAKYDQFMVLPVTEIEKDVYAINFTYAIVTGVYPNTNSSYGGLNYLVVNTPSGLKITNNSELTQKATNFLLDIAPEEYLEAMEAGNNATVFNTYTWINCDNSLCIEGSVEAILKFMWQDDNGDVYVNFTLNNGTNINRTIFNFILFLEDKDLGTIFDVIIEEGCSVKKLSNTSFTVKIPADQILTGTKPWGQLHYSLDTSSR